MRVLLTLPEPPGSTGIRPMKETLLTQEGQSMPRPEHPSAVEHRYIGAPVARMFSDPRHTRRRGQPRLESTLSHWPPCWTIPRSTWSCVTHIQRRSTKPRPWTRWSNSSRRRRLLSPSERCKRLPKRSNELRGTGKVRYSLQFPLHRAFHRNRETSKSLRVWRRG
jgi:hypothetical protein